MLLLKPVLPFVSDCIAHVFFYAHHMATVHYENGKYHVHYEMAKDSKEERSDKNTSTSKKDNPVNEHLVTVYKQPVYVIALSDNEYALTTSPSLLNGDIKNNYPPPRLQTAIFYCAHNHRQQWT